MSVTPDALYRLIDDTWPAAARRDVGSFRIRQGGEGGSRVTAATAIGVVTPDEIDRAEAAMQAIGQDPLFMIRQGDAELDARLASRGYRLADPVIGYCAAVDALTRILPPPETTFEVWPSLAIQREIWAAAGIGPSRTAIMDRAAGPKTTLLGRCGDAPAATAFVAVRGDAAMIHAIEVRPEFRRRGMGANLVRAAARWAHRAGASYLSLLVTRDNAPANALYAFLGMTPVGHYHYRCRPGKMDD